MTCESELRENGGIRTRTLVRKKEKGGLLNGHMTALIGRNYVRKTGPDVVVFNIIVT